jgi:cleavage and polyadenylation specificity factor subunit 2
VAQAGNCTLVEYADVRVLVNVGLYSPEEGQSFWSNLPPHDCLVLTDSKLESIGSLPLYVKGRAGKSKETPIFATYPTVKMGQMTLYSYHADISLDGGRPGFSLEEMDEAFAQLRTIKYSQTMLLPLSSVQSNTIAGTGPKNPAAARLSVTMHRAGHVVGAAYLVLQRLQDETRVVVTSTYSLAREDHLEGSNIAAEGSTPDVLVTHPGGPACPLVSQLYHKKVLKDLNFSLPSRQQKSIEDYVMSILRRGGNVLLPVDASGRVVELLFLMNKIWEKQNLDGSYNLVWLGSMTHNTLDFLRSQLEWMNDKLSKQFEHSQSGGRARGESHPLLLRHVALCTNLQELEKEMSNGDGCVVLASGLSMDHGPSRDVLLRWADNDNNTILFTDSSSCTMREAGGDSAVGKASAMTNPSKSGSFIRADAGMDATTNVSGIPAAPSAATVEIEEDADEDGEDGTLGAVGSAVPEHQVSKYTTAFQLLRRWCKAKMDDREMEDSVQVDVFVPRRSPLVGNELKAFVDKEEAKRRAQRRFEEEQAMLREVELAKGRLRLGEDGTAADLSSTAGGNTDAKKGDAASSIAHLPYASKKKNQFDSSLFLKFSKPLHLTFEVREDAVGVGQVDKTTKYGIGEAMENSETVEDDYGISVRPEHFVDIVTGVDPSKFAGGSGRIGEDVKKRGLGFALGADGRKRQRDDIDDEDDDGDELDERGLEAADLSEGTGIIRGRNGRPPSKVSSVPRRLQVLAEIEYIPFEGRISSDMARQTVKSLQPRCCIVLGGPKPVGAAEDAMDIDTDDHDTLQVDPVTILASAFQGAGGTPSNDETLSLNVGYAAYDARLMTIPFRTKAEKAKEEAPPEPIEPHENKIGSCIVSLLDYVATGQKLKLDGSIVLAPKKSASKLPAVYVSEGDVQLTTIAEELTIHGMKPVYSSHDGYTQLLVNGIVIVRKMNDSGKINVEGPLCELFFDVRKMVLQKYVVLE